MDAEPAGNKGSAAEDLEVQARRQHPKASSAKTSRGYLERNKHLKHLTSAQIYTQNLIARNWYHQELKS